MTKILITGGAGFIGSHLVEHFQAKPGWEVVVYDNFRTGSARNLRGMNYQFVRGDVRDRVKVREVMQGVDYVIHLAAMNSVPESMKRPLEYVDFNVNGILTVLEEAERAGVKKLCCGTSATVYGDNTASPKREDMLPMPKSPYAVTQLDMENFCAIFAKSKRLSTACLRCFNVFGPRQNPNCEYAAAIAHFADQAVHGKKITIFGDGTQTRDFVYVKDVVGAYDFVIEHDLEGVYNLASGQAIAINELVNQILSITESQSEVEYVPARPGDIQNLVASVEKLANAGYRCRTVFYKALTETIAALRG